MSIYERTLLPTPLRPKKNLNLRLKTGCSVFTAGVRIQRNLSGFCYICLALTRHMPLHYSSNRDRLGIHRGDSTYFWDSVGEVLRYRYLVYLVPVLLQAGLPWEVAGVVDHLQLPEDPATRQDVHPAARRPGFDSLAPPSTARGNGLETKKMQQVTGVCTVHNRNFWWAKWGSGSNWPHIVTCIT